MDNTKVIKLEGIESDLIPLWINHVGKLSTTKKWPTKDFTEINWDEYHHYGIRGGEYVFIDIDAKGEPGKADRLLHELEESGLDIDTYTVRTKSDGLHLYYKSPKYSVKTMAGWKPDIDIRGVGGYIVGPDVSLSVESWSTGKYVVVNDTKPIDCNIKLPIKGSRTATITQMPVAPASQGGVAHGAQHAVPVIDTSLGGGAEILSMKEIIAGAKVKAGMRDQTLLKISAWCVARGLSDEEIAEEFSGMSFESVPGDEIKLVHLMEKVERDREQEEDILGEALRRFVWVKGIQKIYDLVDMIMIGISTIEYHYPVKTTKIASNGKITMVPVIRQWLGHPDRIQVESVGFKPTSEKIYLESGKQYVNTYMPTLVTPWDEPVTLDDPYLSEFREMLYNLCNNDDHLVDLVISQRAAKVQDLLWTPRWGFIFMSEEHRVGKDFQLFIFARLFGRGLSYFKVAPVSELGNDRNEYLHEAMVTLVNEPKGLKTAYSGNNASENLKLLCSETEVTVKMLYSSRSEITRVYRIPEIHCNYSDAIDIDKDNLRYAPIICKNGALRPEVYNKLGAKIKGDNPKFMRMLMRLLLDHKINPDIREESAPKMIHMEEASEASEGQNYMDVIEAIKNRETMFMSDIQTKQSIEIAISHCTDANPKEAAAIYRRLIKNEQLTLMARSHRMYIVEYDKSHYTLVDKERITRIHATGMRAYYTIRDNEVHAKGYRRHKSQYIDDHFFNIKEWK